MIDRRLPDCAHRDRRKPHIAAANGPAGPSDTFGGLAPCGRPTHLRRSEADKWEMSVYIYSKPLGANPGGRIMMMMNPSKNALGNAGVHYVAARLERQGLTIGFTPPGAPIADMAVWTSNQENFHRVQIKTRQTKNVGISNGWPMSKKNEKEYSQSFFYVFVDWPDPNQQPVCYIVPNAVVAKILWISGKFWYSPPRKDIGIRYLADNFHRPELSFEPEGYGPTGSRSTKSAGICLAPLPGSAAGHTPPDLQT